jgi:hypothetical protein
MTEPDSLVLQHLRAIRADLADQRGLLSEHGVRLSEIAAAVAGLPSNQALDAKA